MRAVALALALALALAITGCAQGNAATQDAKSGGDTKERSTAATKTAFAGRWKFAERCTSKGSSIACKEFLIINQIPAYMEFYDSGRKLRTLAMGAGVTTFAQAKLDPKLVADSTKWTPRIVEADGRIREPSLIESYYHLGTDPAAPQYCFGEFCIRYASDGKSNGALDAAQSEVNKKNQTTPSAQGPVLFGCRDRERGTCTDVVVTDQAKVEIIDWHPLCAGDDKERLAVCPRERRLFGCETTADNPYGIDGGIRPIGWVYAGPDALERCPSGAKTIKAE